MSDFLGHLVRRTLTPETAIRPLRQPRYARDAGEAPQTVEANWPSREERFVPADETRATSRRRATPPPAAIEELNEAPRSPAAEPPLESTADRGDAAGPARPLPRTRLERVTPVAIEAVEAVEEAGPAVRVKSHRHIVAEADEGAESIAADPPMAAETSRPAPPAARQVPTSAPATAEEPRDEALTARPTPRPSPELRIPSPVEAPSTPPASSKRRAPAATKAGLESGPASFLQRVAPEPVLRPVRAEPAALRPALARSLPARRPEAQRSSAVARNETKPTPPDVHITIGRVEIRAVAAAATPERQARPAPTPVESLADYLARRDGQRR